MEKPFKYKYKFEASCLEKEQSQSVIDIIIHILWFEKESWWFYGNCPKFKR